MKRYRFVLEIPAHSEQEAKAKMELLLRWAAFPKDLDVESLAGSLIKYCILNCWEKYLSSSAGTPSKPMLNSGKPR